ncbi:hypothetical protein BDV93DRAFT_514722 [Ceratobasidium sp. AG-I]|nr:hypothetical protein BDV93DRAFT_514722 [Ceratobasidium sp. AG-I]
MDGPPTQNVLLPPHDEPSSPRLPLRDPVNAPMAKDPRHESARTRHALESRLDESRRLNEDLMDRLAAQAKAFGELKAENEFLVKDFTETVEDYGILETCLASAKEEAQQLRAKEEARQLHAIAAAEPKALTKPSHAQVAPVASGSVTSASGFPLTCDDEALHAPPSHRPAPVNELGQPHTILRRAVDAARGTKDCRRGEKGPCKRKAQVKHLFVQRTVRAAKRGPYAR